MLLLHYGSPKLTCNSISKLKYHTDKGMFFSGSHKISKVVARYSSLIFCCIILSNCLGIFMVSFALDINYYARKYTVFCSGNEVEILVKPENWNGFRENEIIINGKFYDIKTVEKNQEGTLLVVAYPDKFDSMLNFAKTLISKQDEKGFPKPINDIKSKNVHCWIDKLERLNIIYFPKYSVVNVYNIQSIQSQYYSDTFRPPKSV
jgi:hypothetical protein